MDTRKEGAHLMASEAVASSQDERLVMSMFQILWMWILLHCKTDRQAESCPSNFKFAFMLSRLQIIRYILQPTRRNTCSTESIVFWSSVAHNLTFRILCFPCLSIIQGFCGGKGRGAFAGGSIGGSSPGVKTPIRMLSPCMCSCTPLWERSGLYDEFSGSNSGMDEAK